MQYFRNISLSVIFAAVYLAVHDIHGVLALPTNARAHDGPLRLFAPPNETLHDSNHGAANSVLQRRAPSPIAIPLEAGELDSLYFAFLPIGQKRRPFRLIVDTGSTDFWVYSATCPTRGNKNGVSSPIVHPNRRTTYGYENGFSVTVDSVRDNVKIGRKTVNMPFGAASQVSAEVASRPEEGVVGFALPSGTRTGQPSLIDILFLSDLIPERVTGWKLSRSRDGPNDGELLLGGANKNLFFPQTLVTVPNLDAVHWKVRIDAVSVGNVQIMGARMGILDTGALHITTSPSDAARIHAAIPLSVVTPTGQYLLPCNNQAVLSLSIGGFFWSIDPRDLVNAPVPPQFGPRGYCFSSVQFSAARAPGEFLVGSTFLKNVYMKVDYEAKSVGIARLR